MRDGAYLGGVGTARSHGKGKVCSVDEEMEEAAEGPGCQALIGPGRLWVLL